MDQIEIKKIGLSELEQLQRIGRQTFLETFAEVNTEENMQKYLDESFAVDKLTAELITPDSEFYFAWLDNRVIGYLKVNFGQAQTELKDPKGLELERIYVLKEFHRKRVGQVLYNTALEIAKRNDADYIWLGVWEENHRALSFYKKNGFIEFDKHIFKLGNDEQTDIMMRLELDKQ
jgi:ribosomal protein S18 acetylase RimI-like enzyme